MRKKGSAVQLDYRAHIRRRKRIMRRTKIVCTMGPACDSVDILKDMMNEGMNVARLNMAHGELEDHSDRIAKIRAAVAATGANVSILMDIKGPEIRIGKLKEASYELK